MTQQLNVHFVNRGYGTDEGVKAVELVKLDLCEFTGSPIAAIRSPFGLGDTLIAKHESTGWVCDLD
jgi:hypothetical protein|tara:strand:- start:440 stop:637 length:198 start_codon:yes stop_codon:yes gene_type:complete